MTKKKMMKKKKTTAALRLMVSQSMENRYWGSVVFTLKLQMQFERVMENVFCVAGVTCYQYSLGLTARTTRVRCWICYTNTHMHFHRASLLNSCGVVSWMCTVVPVRTYRQTFTWSTSIDWQKVQWKISVPTRLKRPYHELAGHLELSARFSTTLMVRMPLYQFLVHIVEPVRTKTGTSSLESLFGQKCSLQLQEGSIKLSHIREMFFMQRQERKYCSGWPPDYEHIMWNNYCML